MKLPEARQGMPVMGIFISIINYLRANTIQNVIGGKLRRSPSGITIEIVRVKTTRTAAASDRVSFKLSTQIEDDDVKFEVSSERSTIIDGTNGPALDLSTSSTEWASGALKFDTLSAAITVDTWVVLEADVDEDFLITDWTLAAKTTAADAKEVGFNDPDPGDPVFQNKVRLIIGKIEFEDDVPTVTQATTLPQMLEFIFTNGKAAKGFTPHHLAL
jgi:hypothetical protein